MSCLVLRPIEGSNNLLIDEIHDPKKIAPKRMGPLVVVATVVTHMFGGSAGREGTAVQMGGALADRLTYALRLNPEDRRILLMAGISAGFSSVFGPSWPEPSSASRCLPSDAFATTHCSPATCRPR